MKLKRWFTPKMKKVIFFDLNNTLVTRHRSFQDCFLETLNEFTDRWDKEFIDWKPRAVFAKFRRQVLQRQTKGRSTVESKDAYWKGLQTALAPYNITVTESFSDIFFQRVSSLQSQRYIPQPGVRDTLSKLGEKYRLAVISNGRHQHLTALLDHAQLSDFFTPSHLFTASKRNEMKPNQTIFQQALKEMGIEPSLGVMVGDSWRHDIFGATRIGMDAVWLNRDAKKTSQRMIGQEKVVTIRNFKQLLAVF